MLESSEYCSRCYPRAQCYVIKMIHCLVVSFGSFRICFVFTHLRSVSSLSLDKYELCVCTQPTVLRRVMFTEDIAQQAFTLCFSLKPENL